MIIRDKRDTQSKVELYKSLFSGQKEVYGTYDHVSGQTRQVKEDVTDRVILNHLQGKKPYGVYLLTEDKTRAIVVDFDSDDANHPLDFVAAARHYGIPAYIERSKSKGYHAWIFFDANGVLAAKARRVVLHILNEIDKHDAEVFPKHDFIGSQGQVQYGNFINAPLFGRLVPEGRTVFLQPDDTLEPYRNQWEFLDSVERVSESMLDDVIETNDLDVRDPAAEPANKQDAQTTVSLGVFQASMGLPPCARHILANGVSHYQRVACFRMAVHLRKIGLPYDIVVAALARWAKKNQPPVGKGVITYNEIQSQVSSAFFKNYKGCGCEDPAIRPYCDPSCPIYASSTPTSDLTETDTRHLPQRK